MGDGRRDRSVPGQAGDGDPAEALDDAGDDALDETDVDPTGNVVHNESVEAMEDAAAEYGTREPGEPA